MDRAHLTRAWVIGAKGPLNRFAPQVRDEAALEEVMAAYDRMHGSVVDDHGMLVSWSQEAGPGCEGGGLAGR